MSFFHWSRKAAVRADGRIHAEACERRSWVRPLCIRIAGLAFLVSGMLKIFPLVRRALGVAADLGVLGARGQPILWGATVVEVFVAAWLIIRPSSIRAIASAASVI